MSIVNIFTEILAYNDQAETNNPMLRPFDWSRRIFSLNLKNIASDARVIPAGGSETLFSGLRSSGLNMTSVMNIAVLNGLASTYRFSVSSGSVAFRANRPIALSALTQIQVSGNNNAVVNFKFLTAESLASVQVGDQLRIKGVKTGDAPGAFNQLNSGLWSIIGKTSDTLSCVRPVGQNFEFLNESVTLGAGFATEVMAYSSTGVQVGDKFEIANGFSFATQRSYSVQAVTPTFVDFVSAIPLPEESGVPFTIDSVIFYSNSKRLLYIEADQECVVRLNGDTGNSNKLAPYQVGNDSMVAYFHKFGDSFQCEIQNKSVNPLKITFVTGE
jgi:hypothetical protein